MFECPYCNRQFSKKCNLIKHIKLHMKGRTIKTSRSLIDAEIELNIINMNFVSFQGKYTILILWGSRESGNLYSTM
jgi:uncharacterized Zn-finger protein